MMSIVSSVLDFQNTHQVFYDREFVVFVVVALKEAPKSGKGLVIFGIGIDRIDLIIVLADTIPAVFASAISGFGLIHRLAFDRT